MRAGSAIGMDGVFDMRPFYARGGFEFSHRNLRMEGVGQASVGRPGIVELSSVPFDLISKYDRHCFGFARDLFLRKWLPIKSSKGFAANDETGLKGYGVIRKFLNAYKIGPLFADSGKISDSLFAAVSNEAAKEPLFLDTPKNNLEALDLVKRHGMTEVFGCARMYCGPSPDLPYSADSNGVETVVSNL